jgi:hypothetical protein
VGFVGSGARGSAAERLRGIESITDVALVHLAVEDLLDELLERVREILDVDTAAVLLIDRPAGELVATAASGLEDEVRQGVRVPIGAGFVGRIAAEVAPVVIEDSPPVTIDATVEPPVGMIPDRHRCRTAIDLPVGSLLALFTDGLVERRGEPIDCGLERLRAALTLEPADTCCRTAIAALTPDAGWTDDAALLVIRRYRHTGD